MAEPFSISLTLDTPEATDALGRALVPCLRPGDVLLLTGPLGAGKSHLARAIIRGFLGQDEEVPSPTFTLVQTYEAAICDLWHADLYRLSHPDEVIELGLDEAFSTAICLVEWPERLGDLTPPDPIRIALDYSGEGRRARLNFKGRPELRAALAGMTS